MSDAQNKALDKIQSLLNLAEHPNTSPEEADSARTMAERLMVKFAIEEHMLAKTNQSKSYKPVAEQFEYCEAGSSNGKWGNPLVQEYFDLLGAIARHNRCRVSGSFSGDAYIVGYESDVWITKIMYTQVRLHMTNMTNPKPDLSKSYDENVFLMHEAGISWVEIGQRMDKHTLLGQADWGYSINKEGKATGRLIGACRRECKRRDLEYQAKMQPKVYRKNFAMAYAEEIDVRLLRMRNAGMEEAGEAGALVLADRSKSVIEMYNEMFPPEQAKYAKRTDTRYDASAQAAGRSAAATADLSTNRQAGMKIQKEIG